MQFVFIISNSFCVVIKVMNRINVFRLLMYSLGLMFSIGVTSCGGNDDDNDESPEKPEKNPNGNPENKVNMDNLIKEIRVTGGIFHLYYFAYDSDGNLHYFTDKGVDKGESWSLKEKGNNYAIFSRFLGSTKGYMDYKYDINTMGYCIKQRSVYDATYAYDSEGFLSEVNASSDWQSDIERYKYQNGDILSCERNINSNNYTSTSSITYKMSSELNDANIDLNQLIYGDIDHLKVFGILGKRSKHIFSSKYYYRQLKRNLAVNYSYSEYDVIVTDITRDSHNRIGQISYTYTINNTTIPNVATISYVYTTK